MLESVDYEKDPLLPENMLCDECGEPLYYEDDAGHEVNDGDYYTPNGTRTDFYVYKCPECGKTFKSYKCI